MSRQSISLPYFLSAIKSHNSDECLIWPFATDGGGYGMLSFEGRLVKVHRLAFKIAHGHWPTPKGCHSCDTPPCFNFRHIFEGTQTQNLQDASNKGRTTRGEECHSSKLSPHLVLQIRAEYIRADRQCGCGGLARKYNVCVATIRDIVKRKIWRHVA